MVDELTVIERLSDALAEAVQRAAASTVMVSARRRVPASGVVWGKGDVVVTADHVIEQEEGITLGLSGGKQVSASVVGRDPGSDLAVLKPAGGSLKAATIAPSTSGRVGSPVLAIGRPDGEPMASFGVIGAVGGPWRTSRGATIDGYLRSDTTFYPGFSGGPLVDPAGRVVGINSSRLGRGAGLTLPAASVTKVVEMLLVGGKIRRGYLGIGSQPVRIPEALAAKLGRAQETGLLVVGVEPASPADKGGLLVGDILVAFGETVLADTDDLQGSLGPESVGATRTMTVLRGGEPEQMSIEVGERA